MLFFRFYPVREDLVRLVVDIGIVCENDSSSCSTSAAKWSLKGASIRWKPSGSAPTFIRIWQKAPGDVYDSTMQRIGSDNRGQAVITRTMLFRIGYDIWSTAVAEYDILATSDIIEVWTYFAQLVFFFYLTYMCRIEESFELFVWPRTTPPL